MTASKEYIPGPPGTPWQERGKTRAVMGKLFG